MGLFPKESGRDTGHKKVPEVHCIVSDGLGRWGNTRTKEEIDTSLPGLEEGSD